MAYIVTVHHNGETWPLRGTTWAYSMDRAQRFATQADAESALAKAKQFMKVSIWRKARIVQVD